MTILKLDDYEVPGFAKMFNVSLPLKDEDASGETSSTASVKKGNKRKKLEVRLMIRLQEADDYAALIKIAEATEKGDAKVYTITNQTANLAGMRQGKFTGDFRADKLEGKQAWEISFTISEHKSVPERNEAREAGKDTTSQQNAGDTIGGGSGGSGDGGDEEKEEKKGLLRTLTEAALQAIDNALAPDEEKKE